MPIKPVLTLAFACLIAGCAAIVGQPTQLVAINTSPQGAQVHIADETGGTVFTGTTPTNVTLQKSDGSYWGGKKFTVTVSKSGFEDQTYSLRASPNGWYLAGNVVFGGLIGWFIVDPLTGNMYTLSPKTIDASLTSLNADNQSDDDHSLSISLIEDVPENLRDQLVQVK